MDQFHIKRRAQILITMGAWLQDHETQLKVVQGVLCTELMKYQEGDLDSLELFMAEAEESLELLIELVGKLRQLEKMPQAWDGQVTVPYGCGHTFVLETAAPAEPEADPTSD